jgi:membrane associated rhomboid family serine protease
VTADRDEWAGRVVFVLAVAVGVAFVAAVLIELTSPPVRQSIAGAIAAAFGAIVGVVALYVHRTRRVAPAAETGDNGPGDS